MDTQRLPPCLLALPALLLIGYALSMRVPVHKVYFFSDEATYYTMAYSLAHDGDIRYQRQDLLRVYEAGYGGGPTGLFLKRDARSGRLYFAKAFVYPLAAAPFVRVLGDNGFFVLHGLLLAMLLAAGYLYLRRAMAPATAALYIATYLLATVAFVYWFWITPEWFNLAVVFMATFLWLYKEPVPGWPRAAWRPRGWLAGGWTDFAAAALYGVAAYAKPPNLALAAPLVVWTAARGKWGRAVAVALVTAAVCLALFGATWVQTGDWNYQGGDRRTFYFRYPLESPMAGFDRLGSPMITELGDVWIPRPQVWLADLIYMAIGRNSGLLVYMFPAVLAALLFLASRGRSLASPHGLLILAAAAEALFFLSAISGNWIGGGGTVGNRYFVGVYPILFFVIPAGAGLLGAVTAWIVAGLFLAQILLNPFQASHNPSMHTKSFPFTLLPTELSLLHNLPFNTNPNARLVALEERPTFLLYFLDDNTYLREAGLGGFWIRGGATAEVVLRAREPLEELVLQVRNGAAPNRVRARLGGQLLERALEPHQEVELRFDPSRHFPYEGTYLYRFTVGCARGFVPRFRDAGSDDFRNLGVFVAPRTRPAVPIR